MYVYGFCSALAEWWGLGLFHTDWAMNFYLPYSLHCLTVYNTFSTVIQYSYLKVLASKLPPSISPPPPLAAPIKSKWSD